MRLALITGLYPTPDNPQSAIFITNRINALRQVRPDIEITAIAAVMAGGAGVRLVKSLMGDKTGKWAMNTETLTAMGTKYRVAPVEYSFAQRSSATLEDAAARSIEKHINVADFDVVHAHWAWPQGAAVAGLCRRAGVPCVMTPHGTDINAFAENPKWKEAIVRGMQKADEVLFISRAMRERARALGFTGEGRIVPNGVDDTAFTPVGRQEARSRFAAQGVTIAGFVGNMKHEKGADRLPEIFARMNEKAPCRFIAVGVGPLREQVESECRKRGLDVTFLMPMPQTELADVFRALDVLIVPSRSEGLGCVALEARACGTPVAAMQAGGLAEAVGEGGIITPQGDTAALAEGALSVKGKGAAADDVLSWKDVARMEAEAYDRLVREKKE